MATETRFTRIDRAELLRAIADPGGQYLESGRTDNQWCELGGPEVVSVGHRGASGGDTESVAGR